MTSEVKVTGTVLDMARAVVRGIDVGPKETFRENKVRKCIDFSPLGKHYPANSGITPAIHRRNTYLLEF